MGSMFVNVQEERLLREQEVADRLGVSLWTVKEWRRRGVGPIPTWLGPQSVRYQPGDVEEWLAGRRRPAQ